MANFRSFAANHLRAALARKEPEQAVIVRLANEQVALAKALTDHDFVHAMASAYIANMTLLHAPLSMVEAHREVESILKNRVNDLKEFVRLLADPQFIAATRAEAAQPAAAPKPYQLNAKKTEEMIDKLVQSTHADGPEPAVHVAASARGQQVTHAALAGVFRANGPLHSALVNALCKAWPQASGSEIQHLAQGWLKARHDPAVAVAEGMKPTGAIYKEAMQRAEILQAQKLGQMPVAVLSPAPAPNPIIAALGAYNGKLQHQDLAMDMV